MRRPSYRWLVLGIVFLICVGFGIRTTGLHEGPGQIAVASAEGRVAHDGHRGLADAVVKALDGVVLPRAERPDEPGRLELVEALARDRNAEQEEPDEHGQLVRVADPMQVRRQLGRSEQKVIAGGEPLLDSSCLVAREAESPRNLDGVGQIRRGRIRACDERCARRFYSP